MIRKLFLDGREAIVYPLFFGARIAVGPAGSMCYDHAY